MNRNGAWLLAALALLSNVNTVALAGAYRPVSAQDEMRARQAQAAAEAQRRAQEEQARAQEEAARRAQEQQARAQEEAARRAQEAQARAQEEAARRAQEEQARAQEQAQMQAQRAQEEAQRRAQEEQARAQAEAARAQQAAARAQEQAQMQAQRAQEAAARQAAEQAVRQQAAQQAAERQAAEQAARQQSAQQTAERRMLEQQARQQQVEQGRQAVERHNEPWGRQQPERVPTAITPGAPLNHEERTGGGIVPAYPGVIHEVPPSVHALGQPPERIPVIRPANPKPLNILNIHPVPVQKAVVLPVVPPGASPEQREACHTMLQNLNAHLCPIPASQAPPTLPVIQQISINNYTNNYQTFINDQPIYITPQNTYFTPVPVSSYPDWYQPQPGWTLASGFTLGSLIQAGMQWLGLGWHPSFMPNNAGFICANNYVPTPWIYVPAYGMWRMAGQPSWSVAAPPFDYTGPISVEVLEPRRTWWRDGWGHRHRQWTNVAYMYNAFFYPDYDRWGYMNHRGYFVWLNI